MKQADTITEPLPHTTFLQRKVRNNFFFQPKLTVNQPDDVYEKEADSLAEKVMRMNVQNDFFFPPKQLSVSGLQRKCAECEEEEQEVMRKEKSEGEIEPVLESYVGSLSGTGEPLPESSRKFFEPRFDYDFSTVKIHTDSAAIKSADSVKALAYTTGNNIVFNQNQFSPETESGKKLLAHELTHVVQQESSRIQPERELNADESKTCLEKVEEVIKKLETNAANYDKDYPDYIKESIKLLREKKSAGKIKCYAFDGLTHGRTDYVKDEIHVDGVNQNWIEEGSVLHEAVHNYHGKKYSKAAKKYGEAVAGEKEINADKPTAADKELLRFKAWTEYWAYRSKLDYYNPTREKEHQYSSDEIHNQTMQDDRVKKEIRKVRVFDPDFDPRTYTPK